MVSLLLETGADLNSDNHQAITVEPCECCVGCGL